MKSIKDHINRCKPKIHHGYVTDGNPTMRIRTAAWHQAYLGLRRPMINFKRIRESILNEIN